MLALILALTLIIGVIGCGGGKQYSLTIAVNGQGVTSPAAGRHEYMSGKWVTITATPDSGWKFDGWSGSDESTNARVVIQMDEDKRITASFIGAETIFDSRMSIESGGRYYLNLEPGYYDVDIGSNRAVTVQWSAGVDQGYNSGATQDYHKKRVPVLQSTTLEIYNPTGTFLNATAELYLVVVEVSLPCS